MCWAASKNEYGQSKMAGKINSKKRTTTGNFPIWAAMRDSFFDGGEGHAQLARTHLNPVNQEVVYVPWRRTSDSSYIG
jgi:hypothetical protein